MLPKPEKSLIPLVNVVDAKGWREGEKPDPFWVKKAGLEAARLTESAQEWTQAIKIYERLRELMPALGPTLDKKAAKAAEQSSRSKT